MAAAIGSALVKAYTPELAASAAGAEQQPAKPNALEIKLAPDSNSQAKKALEKVGRSADEGETPTDHPSRAVSAVMAMQETSEDEVGYGASGIAAPRCAAAVQCDEQHRRHSTPTQESKLVANADIDTVQEKNVQERTQAE